MGKKYTAEERAKLVPVWEKRNLSIAEAVAYTGIGADKLREISDQEGCPFVLWNGTKRLFRRKQLEEYLDKCSSV